jgi:hypothetical protein
MIYPAPADFPEHVTLYPYGEIHETEGFSSFVIYSDGDLSVQQHFNFLRLTPTGSPDSLTFMEVTQIPNITAEEVEARILSEADRRLHPFVFNLPPRENFPFFWIVMWGYAPAPAIDVFIRDNLQGGVFLITMQHEHDFGTRDMIFASHNAVRTFEIFSEPTDACFDARLIITFREGMPELDRFYPHEIFTEQNGLADYVIYIDDFYVARQSENHLRVTSIFEELLDYYPPLFMEITQVSNITAEEMAREIISAADASNLLFHNEPQKDFPYIRIGFISDEDEHHEIMTDFYIRDNENGGVFLATVHFFDIASGANAHYGHMLRTLEIR